MKISYGIFTCASLLVGAGAASIEDCPGYEATNVQTTNRGLTADLSLAGAACNFLGYDVGKLKLVVEAQSGTSPVSPWWTPADICRYAAARQNN